MHIILMYDISGNNGVKMLKLCRRYLNWIQNSVFEGEISDKQFSELSNQVEKLIDKEKDSVILFQIRQEKWLYRKILGKEIDSMDNIL